MAWRTGQDRSGQRLTSWKAREANSARKGGNCQAFRQSVLLRMTIGRKEGRPTGESFMKRGGLWTMKGE